MGLYSYLILTKTHDFLRTLRVLAYLVGLYSYLMGPTHENSRFSLYLTGLSVPRGSLLVPYDPYGSYSRKLRKTHDFLRTLRVLAYLMGLYLYLIGSYSLKLTRLSVPHGSILVPYGSNSRKLTISKFITCCSFSRFILCAGSSIITLSLFFY